MFGLTGTLTATPGNGDELEGHLLRAAGALEQVPACRLYVVSRLPDQPDVVHVVEVWDHEEDHRGSLELESVQRLIADARPILAGMGDRLQLHPTGGKGLPSSP